MIDFDIEWANDMETLLDKQLGLDKELVEKASIELIERAEIEKQNIKTYKRQSIEAYKNKFNIDDSDKNFKSLTRSYHSIKDLIPFSLIVGYEDIKYLSIINQCIREASLEHKRVYIFKRFSFDTSRGVEFKRLCDLYISGKYSIPKLYYSESSLELKSSEIKNQESVKCLISNFIKRSKHNKLSADDFDFVNDYDKFKFLNHSVKPRAKKQRADFNFYNEDYLNYIKKFYNCKKFNKIYENYKKYIGTVYASHLKPSIDHKQPLCFGGDNQLDNLQFLTYLENRSKGMLTHKEWINIKKNNLNIFFE